MSDQEDWEWKRVGKSFVSGRRYGKDLFTLIRYAIMIGLIYLVVMGVLSIKNALFGNDAPEPTVINTDGGDVHNETKSSIFNLLPNFGKQGN